MAILALEIASLEAQQKKLDEAFEFRKTLLHNVVSAVYTMKDAISGGSATTAQSRKRGGNKDGGLQEMGVSSFSLLEAMEEGEEQEEETGRRGTKGANTQPNHEEEEEEGAYEDKMDES
ncbi:UNVERIFIED_CONTAM: hypothetical protein HDU68_006192 [Siphonaria sp. JEL0065]|nr:hypothetical protein HDU68_006192 [Siphonaria sp. JEL0065]